MDRAAEIDGRLHVSLCMELAAARTGRFKAGMWSTIDGTPYTCLGKVATVAQSTPHLYKHEVEAALAATAEAKRQEQARADEQHKTAVSALNSHLSRASSASGQTSSVAKIQAQHLRSKQIDTDDAWIAQLEPATRSLLVKKQPARLTAAERAEARFPHAALAISEERRVRSRAKAQYHSRAEAADSGLDPRSWGGAPTSTSGNHQNPHKGSSARREGAHAAQASSRPPAAAAAAAAPSADQPFNPGKAPALASQQPCSPRHQNLEPAPTYSLHDFDIIAPQANRPGSHSQACTASGAALKAPLPWNVSITMRANSRQGPGLATYLTACAASSKSDRLTPVPAAIHSTAIHPATTVDSTGHDWQLSRGQRGRHASKQGAVGSQAGGYAVSGAPEFEMLVKPPPQAAGLVQPALRCQRSWLLSRQQQRRSLQTSLWQRAQQRTQLGRHLPVSPGQTLAQQGQEVLQSREEIVALEMPPLQFAAAERQQVSRMAACYKELCSMAQKGKAGDIFSRLLLLQVKQGLEAGVGLKPQLVIRSLRALTQLGAESDVLQQRAPGLLPLLRHLRKCVGMSEALFLHHVTYLGASQLLFTPLQLAAMAQEGSRSGVSSLGTRRSLSKWVSMSQLRKSPTLKSTGHSLVSRAGSAYFANTASAQPGRLLQGARHTSSVSPNGLIPFGTLSQAMPKLT